MNELRKRLRAVQERLHAAAVRAGRDPADITLVAVSKTWPAETIVAAYTAGLRHFGENRAEELAEKRPSVTAALGAGHGITWHAIGTLQSRKTHLIAEHADVFHALDRLKIANRLAHTLAENGRRLPVFIEVNVSGESSKAGLDATNWENSATQRQTIRTMFETLAALPGIDPVGLMTMAPWEADEAVIRTVFRRTRELGLWLRPALAGPAQLSMGMTDDFETAVEEGATHIRVGRALFGARD